MWSSKKLNCSDNSWRVAIFAIAMP
jgi:hypothetical protein